MLGVGPTLFGLARRSALPASDRNGPFRAAKAGSTIGATRENDIKAAMSRLNAGESRIDVARDFGVPIEDLETYLGAVHPVAA